MNIKYGYYLALPGGMARAAVDSFLEQVRAARLRALGFGERFGADGRLMGDRLLGLRFPERADIPKGWKRVPENPDAWRPSRMSPALKALREEMEAIAIPGWADFGRTLGFAGMGMLVVGCGGSRQGLAAPMAEVFGEDAVVLVPVGKAGAAPTLEEEPDFVPDESLWGVRRLRDSEYWALKEKAQDKAAAI
jgi:hypothetical protein